VTRNGNENPFGGQTAWVKRLHCPTCANEVFFDSLNCVRCLTGLAVDLAEDGSIEVIDVDTTTACAHRATWGCNWPAVGADPDGQCASCQLVDPGQRHGERSMVPFQSAQRRALYQLAELGVPWRPPPDVASLVEPPVADDGPATAPIGAATALRFAYRSKSAGDEAVIGHRGGRITLDLDEADPAKREEIRATLGEHYRTPLGHIRHELGHYVWLNHVAADPSVLEEFRNVFGDEQADYSAALAEHYARPDDDSWRDEHVSFYASAHPWEDFAESWAQLMHVHDVVETGASWGVVDLPDDDGDARAWLSHSITASVAANELARSMGMRDLYPFALSAGVRSKVEFCWRLVRMR